MRQFEKFEKFMRHVDSMSWELILLRLYCLERFFERLQRIYDNPMLIDDSEASDFYRYIRKGGFHA